MLLCNCQNVCDSSLVVKRTHVNLQSCWIKTLKKLKLKKQRKKKETKIGVTNLSVIKNGNVSFEASVDKWQKIRESWNTIETII